jgi:hypothetical protein
MPKFKLTLNYESIVSSNRKEDALRSLFEAIVLGDKAPETWIAERLRVEELPEEEEEEEEEFDCDESGNHDFFDTLK